MKYSTPLMKTVDYVEEENWVACGHEQGEEDDADDTPVYLHWGKRQIPNGDHLAEKMEEARQIILERNSGSIRCKSKVVIESIGDVCFKMVNDTKKDK